MPDAASWLQAALLVPIVGGSLYSLLCLFAVLRFVRGPSRTPPPGFEWPAVSILKPIHGLERHLVENLRSACRLDYPDYQVVLSVQRPEDPALPVLRELQREFGSERVSVVVTDSEPVVNGKIQNLVGALKAARHEVLLISDSDMRLPPDYLEAILPPLADPTVGCACTLYRASGAQRWFEKLELLSYNAELMQNIVFAQVTGASEFCIGSSVALRRAVLEEIGGLEALRDYLVEDYELARRIGECGYRLVLVPYFIETILDLRRPTDWWNHQVYWDQNTRSARPLGFFFTVLTRAVPFALLFALVRGFDPLGGLVLALALAIRLGTSAWCSHRMGDREGLRSLAWLPLRDLVGLACWATAICKRSFVWRGLRFRLTRDGRIVPRRT